MNYTAEENNYLCDSTLVVLFTSVISLTLLKLISLFTAKRMWGMIIPSPQLKMSSKSCDFVGETWEEIKFMMNLSVWGRRRFGEKLTKIDFHSNLLREILLFLIPQEKDEQWMVMSFSCIKGYSIWLLDKCNAITILADDGKHDKDASQSLKRLLCNKKLAFFPSHLFQREVCSESRRKRKRESISLAPFLLFLSFSFVTFTPCRWWWFFFHRRVRETCSREKMRMQLLFHFFRPLLLRQEGRKSLSWSSLFTTDILHRLMQLCLSLSLVVQKKARFSSCVSLSASSFQEG